MSSFLNILTNNAIIFMPQAGWEKCVCVLDKKPETVAHYIILNLPPFFFECLHANAQLKRLGEDIVGLSLS